MSRIYIEIECPNCGSEDLDISYNENRNIDCFCNECNHLYSLEETSFLMFQEDEELD